MTQPQISNNHIGVLTTPHSHAVIPLQVVEPENDDKPAEKAERLKVSRASFVTASAEESKSLLTGEFIV
ncbi:unnamed protein product [Angiostrongylus costaricensis]|uniref:Phage tail protein n=1 Tax=Angiostrongylus costaricensis TaxID=334426 RepID=A0A0R3PHG6_ANGCS|nr:unnamed protein product [Angiostrongylus costaricensis]